MKKLVHAISILAATSLLGCAAETLDDERFANAESVDLDSMFNASKADAVDQPIYLCVFDDYDLGLIIRETKDDFTPAEPSLENLRDEVVAPETMLSAEVYDRNLDGSYALRTIVDSIESRSSANGVRTYGIIGEYSDRQAPFYVSITDKIITRRHGYTNNITKTRFTRGTLKVDGAVVFSDSLDQERFKCVWNPVE